jgi:periplasmic protein CpxP/Spy
MAEVYSPDTRRSNGDIDAPRISPVTPAEDLRTLLINGVPWRAVLACGGRMRAVRSMARMGLSPLPSGLLGQGQAATNVEASGARTTSGPQLGAPNYNRTQQRQGEGGPHRVVHTVPINLGGDIMHLSRAAALIFAALAMGGSALAQTTVTGQPSTGGANSSQSRGQEAVTRPNTDQMTPDGKGGAPGAANTTTVQLEPGSNSFTEGQVRSRLEEAGFRDIADLRKDDQGIWRGKAMQNGRSVNIGFDFKGNVAAQ